MGLSVKGQGVWIKTSDLRPLFQKVDKHVPLEPVTLDPDLSDADSFLKILKVKCYNWRAEQLYKLHTLRFHGEPAPTSMPSI